MILLLFMRSCRAGKTSIVALSTGHLRLRVLLLLRCYADNNLILCVYIQS